MVQTRVYPISEDPHCRLRFGPYLTPDVRVGDPLECAIRGKVQVSGWKDCGGIRWPVCRTERRNALILTGDLVRACRTEASKAITQYWKVSKSTVKRWKNAVGAERHTLGSGAIQSAKARTRMILLWRDDIQRSRRMENLVIPKVGSHLG